MARPVAPNEVDGVEIISLVDDTLDFQSVIERKDVHRVRDWAKNRKGNVWVKKKFQLPPLLNTVFQCLSKFFQTGLFIRYCLTRALVKMAL